MYFNESLNPSNLAMTDLYSVDKGFYHPAVVYPLDPDFTKIQLQYSLAFKQDMTYTVTVLNDLQDCATNHAENNMFAHFAFTRTAVQSDIVINEVLFESEREAEFIEIYNKSEKVIDLSTMTISIAAGDIGTVKNTCRLTDSPYSLFPANFIVITRNAEGLADHFRSID